MSLKSKQNIRKLLQSIVSIAFITNATAQEAEQSRIHALSMAGYVARGDFGLDQATEIEYLPLRYEFDSERLGFQLLVPMLSVRGPGAVLINLGGVNRAVAGTEVSRETGLGDIVGSVVYHLVPVSQDAPLVDLRLDVKLPTADETRGLGSGETDLNLQLDISRYWGRWLLFSSLGYSFRGDSTLYPELTDGAYVQLGGATQLTARTSAGALLDYREAATSFTQDILEVGPYLSWQLDDHWTVTGLAMFGFTNASVDASFLGQLRYEF